ncbi:Chaperone protein dnaJ 72 [Apostasia shenzhenica]|uniref:Chaperone protein dnaJ 72 n=1 Tax=Apostasia shenzhenica TaxID=1088818 RepID=A0A2I0ASE3_9ASPA|nr:Chaperone protein dnaJ 72 [Apostasia shenzhenica]
MDAGGAEESCYYSLLGIRRNASAAEIRSAYRNLALKWHLDRWTKESPAAVVEAKRKFQLIQEAYSVLSDNGKRAMYDAGLFDPVDDDDDDQDFTDFMGEMLAMMDSVKPEKPDSLEDLQRIFEDIVGGVGTGDEPWRTTPDVPPRRAGGYFAR